MSFAIDPGRLGAGIMDNARTISRWWWMWAWMAWMATGSVEGQGFQALPLDVASGAGPIAGFTRLDPAATGIHFTNALPQDRHLTNQILLNGSGVAAGDIDGDGWCDLYFCGLNSPNTLYKNLGGWRFQDITATAGVACPDQDSTGVALADLDGDGDLDLMVASIARGLRWFFNEGHGRFREARPPTPVNFAKAGMSIALADMDADGDLDVYVTNYRTVTIRDQPNTKFQFQVVDGQAVVTSIGGRPLTDPEYTNRFDFEITVGASGGKFLYEENGEPDLMLRNDGNGMFAPVSFTDGTFLDETGAPLKKPPFDWGLSVLFRDLNGDRAPDLYVCNDFKSPDRIWINDGRGRFRAIAFQAIRQTSLSSMGVDAADINRDGFDDLFIVDMLSPDLRRRLTQRMETKPQVYPPGGMEVRPQSPRNTLLLNRGDGTYAEIAQLAGLEATDWSWTPAFLDVDLDGYEDVLVSNGFERDGMNVDALMQLDRMKKERERSSEEQLRLRRIIPRLDTPNFAFRNQGDLTFRDHSALWGFNDPGVSHGIVLADLDKDGDQDVVVSNLNGAPGIYRNRAGAPRLAVRLKGLPPNTHGVGSRILVTGGPVPQSQEIVCGGRYLSSDEPLRTFAAGPGDMTIEVLWRSGRRSQVTRVRANHLYVLDEPSLPVPNRPESMSRSTLPPKAWLVAEPGWPGHTHVETPFDDWDRQPMLAHRLSQPGPGLAWFDLDGDGGEELIVGPGAGGQWGVFQYQQGRGFQNRPDLLPGAALTRDQTGIVGWTMPGGKSVVLAGTSNYEESAPAAPLVRAYHLAGRGVEDLGPIQAASAGPLALADVDGDGDLDLFAGARVVPGRFPEPAASVLFRNQDGAWMSDAANQQVLERVGLVHGAVFSDIDADGDPDLVLACHFGPVRVLRNHQGRFEDVTEAMGLGGTVGMWNGVATGDVDGDGRMDILASNWGRNTRYERFRAQGLAWIAGDLDGNGFVEVIEAVGQGGGSALNPIQPMHVAMRGMPQIGTFLARYEHYAKADLAGIYGADVLKGARRWDVRMLESAVFLNRGKTFEARLLPVEAQMAPAFAVCVADLDGDGLEDVVLSQNFFATHPEISRYDAGRGLVLRGDGRGGFQPVPGQESGLKLYGEQRGAVVGDYDADGRVDVVVGQNAAETRVFKNQGATPGLRVRLVGGPGNPHGVGAVLRVASGSQRGPAREIQAGSGYYGQNSAIQVLAVPPQGVSLWVRWPGGREFEVAIPAGARELSVDASGAARAVPQ